MSSAVANDVEPTPEQIEAHRRLVNRELWKLAGWCRACARRDHRDVFGYRAVLGVRHFRARFVVRGGRA